MSSLLTSTRQVGTNTGYFIPIADARTKVFAYNPTAGATTFSTAAWTVTKYASSIAAAGAGLIKDMGRTVVSSGRTFRKVQLVTSTVSTFGVGGSQGTTPIEDYLTGYIELGFDGNTGLPAPFAVYGR
jgi:hypothetical protein